MIFAWLVFLVLVFAFFAVTTIQNKMMDDTEDEYNELKHLTKEQQEELK